MKRLQRLRAGIGLDHEVLEIGPYHSPIAPKSLGYRATTLDLVDADALRARAKADPSIDDDGVKAIEEVDLVGSACDVAKLVAKRFDWILASHTIEHMPDPIRFLEECAKVLAPGGVLRMAVPARDAKPAEASLALYRQWFAPGGSEPTNYIDTHCWAFTPESFELKDRTVNGTSTSSGRLSIAF